MVSSVPSSPSMGGGARRGETGGQLLQELEALSQALYNAGQHAPSPRRGGTSPYVGRREGMLARGVSETHIKAGSVTPPSVSASSLKSAYPRPPVASRPSPTPSTESGKKTATYRLNVENSPQFPGFQRPLKPWHSQGFEKNLPAVTNFPSWLGDNLNFSQKLEVPEEKKSLWNWKPFRAIAHIGQQRFNCVFTVRVHGIEGLPSTMNGLRLTVHWRRKDDNSAQTMPSRVFQGSAEFEETLKLKCTVYGSKNASHSIKYMPKCFYLSVIALDVDELVLGKHRLDFSRLLPDNLEDTDDEEKENTWTTSFKLSGKAKGGTLVVTFGYQVLKDLQPVSSHTSSFGESPIHRSMRSYNSLPNSAHGTPRGRHSDAHLSPALSEPLADFSGYLGMEHLSLDEHASLESPNKPGKDAQRPNVWRDFKAFSAEDPKRRLFPQAESMMAPQTPQKFEVEPCQVTKDSDPAVQSEDHGNSEDEAEFTVVEQGVEMGTLPDTVSIRGLTDVEAENVAFVQEEEEVADTAELDVEVKEELWHKEGASEKEEPTQIVVVNQQLKHDEVEMPTDVPMEAQSELQDLLDAISEGGGDLEREEMLEEAKQLEVISLEEEGQEEVVAQEVIHEEEDMTTEVPMDDASNLQDLLDSISEGAGELETEEKLEESEQLKGGRHEGKEEEDSRAWTADSLFCMVGQDTRDEDKEGGKQGLDMAEEDGKLAFMAETQTFLATEQDGRKRKTGESDDEIDSVAGEFLDLLETEGGPIAASDSEPNSPRALLLKQFEQEALLEGGIDLGLNLPEIPQLNLDDAPMQFQGGPIDDREPSTIHKSSLSDELSILGWGSEEDVELSSIMEAAESELEKATQTMRSKSRAKIVEDAENEALMQEWGLNKRVFEDSLPEPQTLQDFESSYSSALVQTPNLPALEKGFGSAVQIRDGGSLRSMSPVNFQASDTSGRLVMQVSKPLVVPAEMGSNAVDVLRCMAAAGMEGMAIQAMMAMPLEDIMGKTVEQIASEGLDALEGGHHQYGNFRNGYAALGPAGSAQAGLSLEYDGREGSLANRAGADMAASSRRPNKDSRSFAEPSNDFMSLEDLAPMAMQKIEALAMQGLKIQSDMVEEEAPYSVDALSWQEMAALEGGSKERRDRGTGMLKGVTALHLLEGGNTKEEASSRSDDGFMSMAISLDEWMRLDAGVYDEAETKENTRAILAAHNAVHRDVVVASKQKENKTAVWGKTDGKGGAKTSNVRGGFMGDTLTLAMLVQLRDPLRNYEPVGAPMMALVQAERVMMPPPAKLGRRVSIKGNSEEEEEPEAPPLPPQFKIVEVTMSGLKASESVSDKKKEGWGNQKHQQSGSRWLLANGMGKTPKHPVLKSKAPLGKTKVQKGESLWSISSRVHGTGSKWREVAALNPQIRNPDVIFENTSIRTK